MQIRPEGMGIDGRFRGFVPRRRPLFDMWLKFLENKGTYPLGK